MLERKDGERGAETEKRAGTVLIIEEEPQIVKLLKRLCDDSNIGAITASSGDEALTLLEERGIINEIGIVVLDFGMNGDNGNVVLEKLRKMGLPSKAKTVLITGDDPKSIPPDHGFDEVVSKAFGLEEANGFLGIQDSNL